MLNTVEATGKKLGTGRARVFELIAAGELRSVKIGRRRMISDAAIEDFVTRLEAQIESGTD
jgi:excisionase family DNA binding protein